VDLELDKVAGRLSAKGIILRVSEKAKEFLAEQGFDANLGARPLRRVIQKLVLDPLALKIVRGEAKEGERLLIDFDGKQIIFGGLQILTPVQKRDKVTAKQ